MTDITRNAIDTQAVWAGETARNFWEHATQVPVVHSASFGYHDLDEWLEVAQGRKPGHIYSRNTNPTVAVFEEKMRILEHAEAATSFATGMGAVSNTLFALLAPGDHVVSIKDSYGGTNRLFQEFLPRIGVRVTLCDTEDEAAFARAVAGGCQLVYVETPTNPTLKVVDIAAAAAAAQRAGAILVADNTFATPINTRPLDLGADLVLHSATKFLSGHEDVMGGVVCGKTHLVERVFRYREITGASLAPASAYLLIRSLKTLVLRVRQQNANALAVATWLERHPKVEAVFYPGLASNRGHAIAQRQMTGFGGVLAFALKGGWEAVKRFLPRLELAHCAPSLGGVQTLVGPPATTSHVECTPEQRAAMGIPESLLRYSVGVEDSADLIADMTQALDGV
jgi:cystathionine gamma-synthase